MGDQRWWRDRRREDLYELTASARDVSRVRAMLETEGYAPADEMFFPAGAMLLRDDLASRTAPDTAELSARVVEFAARPRPFLPYPSTALSIVQGAAARSVESEAWWVDPARVFPGRDGTASFFRDQGDWQRRPQDSEHAPRHDPVMGLAEFAARIAAERGDPAGLAHLFGPSYATGMPMLDLLGWQTPLGAVFRVNTNGNHRLAALAVLGVPCVLAEVTWCYGPFDGTTGRNMKDDDRLSAYRVLLHSFGVASFPDPLDIVRNHTGIITDWPILISTPETAVASLNAMEAIAGRSAGEIGRLPRSLFTDPDRLLDAGEEVRHRLNALAASILETASSDRKRGGWFRWFSRR